MTIPHVAEAQNLEPLRYSLGFPAPYTHYIEVSASIPTGGAASVELMMAVWTPGSYLVREYARHVEALVARTPTGAGLAVEKSAKNRWRVQTGGAATVNLTYRVYGREMSVRTNWVDADFALVNGAPTFLTLVGGLSRPHEVEVVLPDGWTQARTTLPAVAGSAHRFRAPDYDTLVDSPMVLGNPAVHEFVVDGKPHALVNVGEAGVFDGAQAARDLEKVVLEHRRMWGALPYERYLFFNMITEAGGGLEHASSSVLMTSRWATRTRKAYVAWLQLASHEFFHAWNVKRLRPAELGPFDYERENATRSLWVVEGITDYYGDLAVHRAGLADQKEYLGSLSETVKTLQTTPGRQIQAVEMSSYDAWVRQYRPDENSPNVAISYYTKGYVLAWLLDARIRDVTKGAKSLDDVMRTAYGLYSGTHGYTQQEFQAVAEQVAGASLADFWEQGVSGVAELDYARALAALGLRFKPLEPPKDGEKDGPKAHLGGVTRTEGGRLLVSQVHRGTPAYAAGLNVDDEIVGIDDFRVQADQLSSMLEQYKPGDTVSILVARRGRFQRLGATFGAAPAAIWTVEPDPVAPDLSKTLMTNWLSGRP
ncbi:MAG: PDZ domain-containing protein [Vicinamibacterales bacterium]